MTRPQSQIEVLYEEEDVRGELYPLPKTGGRSVLACHRNQEGGHLSAIGVPITSRKRRNLKNNIRYEKYSLEYLIVKANS